MVCEIATMNSNSTSGKSQDGVFFGPSPSVSTPTLQTIAAVAEQLGKSRSRLKEICREIGLEPIRAAGSTAWLFDDLGIRRLQDELARREREGRI